MRPLIVTGQGSYARPQYIPEKCVVVVEFTLYAENIEADLQSVDETAHIFDSADMLDCAERIMRAKLRAIRAIARDLKLPTLPEHEVKDARAV